MKLFLCFLLFNFPLFHACGEDDAWSKPDKGLRGRLVVLPAEKPDSPFCRVFIELQNTEDVMGQRKVRFKPEKLDVQVTGKDGRVLAQTSGPYDGMTPLWEPILLPYAGTIKFQINFPGLGYHPVKTRSSLTWGRVGLGSFRRPTITSSRGQSQLPRNQATIRSWIGAVPSPFRQPRFRAYVDT